MEADYTNVLLMEANILSASKIRTFLGRCTEKLFRIWHSRTLDEALCFLKEKSLGVDIVVLDLYSFDPAKPEKTYKVVKENAGEIPIIVVIDKQMLAEAHKVIANGASNIVIREKLESYPQRLLGAIEFSLAAGKPPHEIKENGRGASSQKGLRRMTDGYSADMTPIRPLCRVH